MTESSGKRLPTTDAEQAVIRDTIKWMAAYMLRLNLDPLGRPLSLEAERRSEDAKKVDTIIAGGMDRIRQVIDVDFFEKTYDMVADEVDNKADPNMIFLWVRMMNTLTSVISVTRRYRGISIQSPINIDKARRILVERGLWKKREVKNITP